MILTTTKERIVETAENNPFMKDALKSLFPEAFSDEVNIKFKIGDKLIQKGTGKIYLITVGSGNYLRIVSLTSAYVWDDQKVKLIEKHQISPAEVRRAFGLRNLKNYTLQRGDKMIEL